MISYGELASELFLIEDVESDKRQRKAAKQIVKGLKNYVRKEGEDAFREISPNRKYIILASDFMEEPDNDIFPPLFTPSDVRFYFVTGRRHENPFYQREKIIGGDKYSVFLPFLRKDQPFERIADKIAVKQGAIMHELTHMLDDLRTIQSKDLTDMRQADEKDYASGGKGYYNEPFELNAFFQQAIADFEEFVERSPETLTALSDQMKDFRSFKEFMFSQQFDNDFINSLSDKNRKKVLKRLYQFYQDFRESELFQKNVK